MSTYPKSINYIKIKKSNRNNCVIYLLIYDSAGIGDGGNDVGMIQLASIGLGIVGK